MDAKETISSLQELASQSREVALSSFSFSLIETSECQERHLSDSRMLGAEHSNQEPIEKNQVLILAMLLIKCSSRKMFYFSVLSFLHGEYYLPSAVTRLKWTHTCQALDMHEVLVTIVILKQY